MSLTGAQPARWDDALRIHLVGGSQAELTEIKRTLDNLEEPLVEVVGASTWSNVMAGAMSGVDATMLLFDRQDEACVACLQSLAERSPRAPLLALLRDRSTELIRLGLSLGADELLFLPLEPSTTIRTMLQMIEARRRARRHNGGTICSFTSTVGGVGVTSLSANLAFALSYGLGKRVALVDLDVQSGGLAEFLNLEPEHSILSVASRAHKLDSIELESALCRHPSGVYLLASPGRIADGERLSEKATGEVLDLMREVFDLVIVDCGGAINKNVVAAWRRSDHIFYLLDQSINATKCACRFAELFEQIDVGGLKPKFIVNRFNPRHPVDEEQLTYSLGQPVYARIPRDDKAMERVEARGLDLWQVASSSPLTRSIDDLAQMIVTGQAVVPERPSSVIPRLLAAVGAHQVG